MADSVKERWLKSLVVRLTAQRRYPPTAGNQGGTAKVLFHIDRSGRLISVALIESTGDPALDKEALAIVERSQPFPPPPSEVEGDDLDLHVPFKFPPRPASAILQDLAPEAAAVTAKLKSICRGC